MKRTPSVSVECLAWRGSDAMPTKRTLAAEVPVAFVYDGGAEAVMMATPADLEDFAFGFSLNDGIIVTHDDIAGVDVVGMDRGVELRIVLKGDRRQAVVTRRRRRAGPVGCGLCGIESVEDALPKLPAVNARLSVTAKEIVMAMRLLEQKQTLNAETRAVHAAAFYVPGEGIVAVREDIGRHNALDKLTGALFRAGRSASSGAILMTSRVSVELIQKAAMMGAPILAAISAPTALALSEALATNITVAGIVRDDGLEIFSHPKRFNLDADAT